MSSQPPPALPWALALLLALQLRSLAAAGKCRPAGPVPSASHPRPARPVRPVPSPPLGPVPDPSAPPHTPPRPLRR